MKKNELFRVSNILERDRIGEGNKIDKILEKDLELVLREYFDINKPIMIQINKGNGVLEIMIKVKATSVKKCNILP